MRRHRPSARRHPGAALLPCRRACPGSWQPLWAGRPVCPSGASRKSAMMPTRGTERAARKRAGTQPAGRGAPGLPRGRAGGGPGRAGGPGCPQQTPLPERSGARVAKPPQPGGARPAVASAPPSRRRLEPEWLRNTHTNTHADTQAHRHTDTQTQTHIHTDTRTTPTHRHTVTRTQPRQHTQTDTDACTHACTY